MATITQKWNNLANFIIAKAEHKEKFGNKMDLNNNIYTDIIYIGYCKKAFLTTLRCIITLKYQKYITERKITIPKLDDITEYNPDECCPVCFENFEDENDICEGHNCVGHQICLECFDKIVNDTNRCPICRAVMDYDYEKSTETETDTDDEMLWGDNERPTTDLFYGRRWYNVEENRIETYADEWRTNINHMRMSSFMLRYSYNDSNEASPILRDDGTCCIVCGIQRTPEVYDYMDTIYPDGYNFPANQLEDGCFQVEYFDADNSEPNIRCYDCELKFHLLQGVWMSM